jgi:hypothetical protein
VKRAIESSSAPAQQPERSAYVAREPAQALGIPESPYLTLDEGARFCRFDATAQSPVIAFRKWLHRNSVPVRRRGRVLLVERRVLEAVLRGV